MPSRRAAIWAGLKLRNGAIGIEELDAEPGWILVRDRCSVALIRRLISRQNADDLHRRVTRHIRGEQQPELSDMRIVRGPAQLDARMPTFVTAFLQEQWRQGTAKTYRSASASCGEIIRNRCEFPLQAKRGAFSPAACGDPVFRARKGSGRLAAKDLLRSGLGDRARNSAN